MLGLKIRKIREKKGMSQEYLAEHLSMSQSTLARIEQGKSKLASSLLPQVCEILEIELETLFNNEKVCIENNTFTDASTLNGYIEHYTACQKELYENQITSLKEEITALRGQVVDLLGILKKS